MVRTVSEISLPSHLKILCENNQALALFRPQYLFQITLQALASDLLNTRAHNRFLSGWHHVPKYSLFFSALRTWWWLVRAHQLIWKEILLQLQDRGVPVGEAQGVAWEVAITPFTQSTWFYTLYLNQCHLKIGYVANICLHAYLCLCFREQRQKEATKTAVVNSFPKDRDYRREAMQASAAPGFTGASKCRIHYYNTQYPYQSAVTDLNASHVCIFCCLAGPKYQEWEKSTWNILA